MPNTYFRFKQFTIRQERCAMKVGTDGVLLGAWCDIPQSALTVLDVGTGTGLLALMIAQRSHKSQITAVEIDAEAARQARENVVNSPWAERIEVVHTDFRSFESPGGFDRIVANPPFFEHSLLPPDGQRGMARHDLHLSYNELLKGVSALLSVSGEFSVILPASVAEGFADGAAGYGLYPSRRTDVMTSPGKPPKRVLLAFRFEQGGFGGFRQQELLIEEARHVYSPEFKALTEPFYLAR